ncbi:MAG TPA: DUF1579 family protein [Planctomycetota bacterium]|nr:DUF1579 family protein [Planctomycetota bacterium]
MTTADQGPPPLPPRVRKHFEAFAGTWDCEIAFAPGAPFPPMKGLETNVVRCGGYVLTTDVEVSEPFPFSGHGAAAWDALKGKLTSTWADSSGAPMQFAEGDVTEDGLASTARGASPDMTNRRLVPIRQEHRLDGPEGRVFTTYAEGPDGKEMPIMTIRYRRRR